MIQVSFSNNIEDIWDLTQNITGNGDEERHETIGLKSKTMAVHVRYNCWFISLPSSANQQREFSSERIPSIFSGGKF